MTKMGNHPLTITAQATKTWRRLRANFVRDPEIRLVASEYRSWFETESSQRFFRAIAGLAILRGVNRMNQREYDRAMKHVSAHLGILPGHLPKLIELYTIYVADDLAEIGIFTVAARKH